MKSETDEMLEAVPEVVLECYIQQQQGVRMTRVRVEGRRHELEMMLNEFQMRVRNVQHTNNYF